MNAFGLSRQILYKRGPLYSLMNFLLKIRASCMRPLLETLILSSIDLRFFNMKKAGNEKTRDHTIKLPVVNSYLLVGYG